MNNADRVARLLTFAAEGRLRRQKLRAIDGDGQERVHLLAALAPEVGEAADPSACPANVMPQWLAQLTPSFDDHTSLTYWPAFVQCYAYLAGRWHALNAAAWRRCEIRACIAALEVVLPHDIAGVVASALALLRRELAGDEPTPGERRAVSLAAASATRVSRTEAMKAAAWAAHAAVLTKDWAPEATARAAAGSARSAARAKKKGEEATLAVAADWAGRLAWEAAWDYIAVVTLSAIEAEIKEAEHEQQ